MGNIAAMKYSLRLLYLSRVKYSNDHGMNSIASKYFIPVSSHLLPFLFSFFSSFFYFYFFLFFPLNHDNASTKFNESQCASSRIPWQTFQAFVVQKREIPRRSSIFYHRVSLFFRLPLVFPPSRRLLANGSLENIP